MGDDRNANREGKLKRRDMLKAITAVPAGYVAGPSMAILPASGAATSAYSRPVCPPAPIPTASQCGAR